MGLDGFTKLSLMATALSRSNLMAASTYFLGGANPYPLIVEALAELPEGTVVDGEVVALGAFRVDIHDVARPRSTAS